MANCVSWALSFVTGTSMETLDRLFRRYVDAGWVKVSRAEYDDNLHWLAPDEPRYGPPPEVVGVKNAAILAIMPELGWRATVPNVSGASAARWAHHLKTKAAAPTLLIVDTNKPDTNHMLVIKDGMIFDNATPQGAHCHLHQDAAREVIEIVRLHRQRSYVHSG